MNILFLTLARITDINQRGIYTDLLGEFCNNGHKVYVITPNERKFKKGTTLKSQHNSHILGVKTFNLQKTNLLEKGIGTLALEYQYLAAIKKYFSTAKFDLVLYSTPPITFSKVISFFKKRDKAYAYLLLKDIFPQNAVDLGLIKKRGMLHKFFLKKERKLYQLSDTIGCMSEANKNYILKHNKFLADSKVEVNPNSIYPIIEEAISATEKKRIREKYNLPTSKKIFLYGGNLGLPQGIEFLLETIFEVKDQNAFFLIVGSGTEYKKVERWFKENKPLNACLMSYLDKADYDILVKSCDVGLIFLHKNFTIPNFPSRLLSYLEMGLPVIAATDRNTDIGKVIESHNCGFWIETGDIEGMAKRISKFTNETVDLDEMKKASLNLLVNKYHVSKSFKLIVDKL